MHGIRSDIIRIPGIFARIGIHFAKFYNLLWPLNARNGLENKLLMQYLALAIHQIMQNFPQRPSLHSKLWLIHGGFLYIYICLDFLKHIVNFCIFGQEREKTHTIPFPHWTPRAKQWRCIREQRKKLFFIIFWKGPLRMH